MGLALVEVPGPGHLPEAPQRPSPRHEHSTLRCVRATLSPVSDARSRHPATPRARGHPGWALDARGRGALPGRPCSDTAWVATNGLRCVYIAARHSTP